jgi:uncharacterized surface protein with fasciclin (FAS1) repeats
MQNQNILIGVGVAIVIAAIGVFVYAMNMDEDETTDTNSQTSSQVESEAETMNNEDIVQLAVDNSDLSTLVTALQAAELVETLQGEGPFTVFAPTNSAFDKLPEGTLDELLQPENKQQLTDILTYHVVSGNVMAADLSDGQTISTLQGDTLTVEISDGMVMLVDTAGDKATVTVADVEASNGVVHLIDSVVMPQS